MGKHRRDLRSRARTQKVYAVQATEDFEADVQAQVAWLLSEGDLSRIEALERALVDAMGMLSRYPRIGPPDSDRRHLVLRRLPFVVWYELSGRKVVLLRLFHARQERTR